MEAIRSPLELYARAIAIEREAAERYDEFAIQMSDLGNEAVAALFARLSALETEHLHTLERRTEGTAVPDLRLDQYRWLDAGAPETAARELIYRLLTPRMALAIALDAEKRAQAFFGHVCRTAKDPALRGLAQEMAMEEAEHVAMVERMLDQTPDPNLDWAAFLEGKQTGTQSPET